MRVTFYIKNSNEVYYNQPRFPLGLKSNAATRLFRLLMYYRFLTSIHVTHLRDVIGGNDH